MVLVVFTVEGVVISRTCKVEMMLSLVMYEGCRGEGGRGIFDI